MCLVANTELTKKFLATQPTDLTFKVYKVFKLKFRHENAYGIPVNMRKYFLSAPYRGYKYKPGDHTCVDSKIVEDVYTRTSKVHDGLHVCLTKAEAEALLKPYNEREKASYIVVELEAKLEDLVAVGHFGDYGYDTKEHADKQAVFKKITISPEQHKQLLKTLRKQHKKANPDQYKKRTTNNP